MAREEVDRVDVVRLIGKEVGQAQQFYPKRFQQYYTAGAVMIIIGKLVHHVTQKGGPGVEVIYMSGYQQIEIWELVGAGGLLLYRGRDTLDGLTVLLNYYFREQWLTMDSLRDVLSEEGNQE